MTAKLEYLDRVDLVSLHCPIWTGTKRLRSDDIELGQGGKLPPEPVATLGSKRIIDPDELAVFRMLKSRAEHACEAVGVRFLRGYAIPREKTEAVSQALDGIAGEFRAARDKFLARYDQAVESWVRQYPEFEPQLRKELTPVGYVAKRLGFEYAVYRVSATAAVAGSLADQAGRMGSQLLHEVAVEANELYRKSFAGTAGSDRRATRRSLRPIRRMREKLAGLAFLDSAITPMVLAIDSLLAALPKTGPLEGELFYRALGIVLILSDPDKVRRHGAGQLQVAEVAGSQDDLFADEDAVPEDDVRIAPTQPPAESLYF